MRRVVFFLHFYAFGLLLFFFATHIIFLGEIKCSLGLDWYSSLSFKSAQLERSIIRSKKHFYLYFFQCKWNGWHIVSVFFCTDRHTHVENNVTGKMNQWQVGNTQVWNIQREKMCIISFRRFSSEKNTTLIISPFSIKKVATKVKVVDKGEKPEVLLFNTFGYNAGGNFFHQKSLCITFQAL